MGLAIIGFRGFVIMRLCCKKIHELIDVHAQNAIVSGGAKGAGSLAERFADEHDLQKMILSLITRHGRATVFL